jgi:cystathionine beta-lyase/cystathionine gamma-synthase
LLFVPAPPRQVDGDLWRTAAFIDAVRLPRIAPSLGGVESLIEQPTIISYWDQVRGPGRRARAWDAGMSGVKRVGAH